MSIMDFLFFCHRNQQIKVVLSGGRANFLPANTPDPEYPDDPYHNGKRLDGDLIEVKCSLELPCESYICLDIHMIKMRRF